MRAALLTITLLFLISGPMEARHKTHRPGYSVHGFVDVSPYYGGSFYFGTRPHYGYGPSYGPYYAGPGYRYDRDAKYRYKSYKKYLKHKKKMLKKLNKQHRRHHHR